MEKLKSRIVVLNSLRSRFFLVLMAGLWLVMMLVINKVEILQDCVIIEPWASALSRAGLKSIIQKRQIKSVEYLPGGRFTGEMIIKYADDKKEKKLYVGITENGAGDINVIRRFFRNR